MIALAPPLLAKLVITPHGSFGVPRPNRNGTHYGLDFHAAKGQTVVSATEGTVARTGFDKPVGEGGGGGGNYVIVQTKDDDGQIYEVGYMHLDSITAKQGDTIHVGDEIGKAGDTGSENSGPHLHFQVKKGVRGSPVDPTELLGLKAAIAGGGILLLGGAAFAAWWFFLRKGRR